MLTFEKRGRNLVLTVEGVDEPFSIPPLPARAGVQITDTYLNVAGGNSTAQHLADTLSMAVDGAVYDADAGRYVPRPEAEQTNYTRASSELSQEEAENVLSAAFFWQSALGVQGVRMFIDGGEGVAGSFRALSALTGRVRTLFTRGTTEEVPND